MRLLSDNILIQASEKFDTPLFLYSTEIIKKKYVGLRNNLTKICDIHYSIKANPLLAICEYMYSLGANCEVASKNELLIALSAGFDPSQIIYVGPGKTDDSIELGIQRKIKYIICESIDELYQVDRISKKYNRKTPILIRINPDFFVAKSPIKMSGVASQFGIHPSALLANLDSIKKCRFILIEGIHVYNASRVLNLGAIIDNISQILSLADQLSSIFDINWKTIDLGGGFGIPYFQDETALDYLIMTQEINVLLNNYHVSHQSTRFILELGRYLVGESGYLVTSVLSVKNTHNKNYVIVDAGINAYLAATGLASFVHRNFPMMHISTQSDAQFNTKENYQIVGPLCTPGDSMLKDVELPPVKIKDLIVILQAGAYGLTASPGRFISHGHPAEVLFHHNQFYLSRKRESVDDILSLQVSLKNKRSLAA